MFQLFLSMLFMQSLAVAAPLTSSWVDVDLNRYVGRWYEVASTQPFFQKGCVCSRVDYGLLESGNISVTNACNIGSGDGPINSITGVAVPSGYPGLFTVSLGGTPNSIPNYKVVTIARDYSWAVVSSPIRWPIWILSRTQSLPAKTRRHIKQRLRYHGYYTFGIRPTLQENCSNRQSILETLAADSGFSTFRKAVKMAGLERELDNVASITVFAPSNAAFAKMADSSLEALFADTELLRDTLRYHMLRGYRDLNSLESMQEGVALSEQTLDFTKIGGATFVNQSRIIGTAGTAVNGMLHKIDTVLIP